MSSNGAPAQQRAYGVPPPGFRVPDDAHIGAVRLQVSDLGRTLEYYQQVMGLRVVERTSDAATLGPHDDGHVLVSLQTKTGVTPARRGAFGLYHFAILLPDRASLGRFAAHLSDLGVRVGMADHLVSEALYLWDPDGLGIEVYCDRPRSGWRRNDRELVMTTEPLDVGSVIEEAGESRWLGMPPGTTMGHVHLHVGNLEQAERFYHVGLGLDKTVWNYPGALFLAAGGYHHHLGTNIWAPGPAAAENQARLLEWELIVPGIDEAAAAAESILGAGYAADHEAEAWTTIDPWGTRLRIVSAVGAAASHDHAVHQRSIQSRR